MAKSDKDKRSKEELLDLYERMLRIRRFEEKVSELFANNKIPGFVHLYIGQEAIAVGACTAVTHNDYITSTHRGHGHVIASGSEYKPMMAELFGKKNGYCQGKGGSMHITNMDVGMLGANGIVSGSVPLALGAAYRASKLKKNEKVVLCFFGDGATGEGRTYEGINVAGAWKLPVIFVCENNQYGVGTRVNRVHSNEDIASRMSGFNIPTISIDGNDVIAVNEAVEEAVKRSRDGKGPSFIECKTWRHHGHFEGEELFYIDEEEHKKWLEHDPIKLFSEKITKGKHASKDELDKIEEKVVNELNEAIKYAEDSEYPEPKEALKHVFSE